MLSEFRPKNYTDDLRIVDPMKPVATWDTTKIIWRQRWNNMVKFAKETSTSQWAAPILLGLLLTYSVYNNQGMAARQDKADKQMQETHDLLIKLETLREVEDKEKAQERIDKKLDQDMAKAYRENMNDRMQTLTLIVQGKYPNTLKKEGDN